MNTNEKENNKSEQNVAGAGVALGVGLGLALGTAIGHVGAGLAIGIAVGLGFVAKQLRNKKSE